MTRRTAAVFRSWAAVSLLAVQAPLLASGKSERVDAEGRAREFMAAGKYGEAAEAWEKALAPGAADRDLKANLPSMGRCYEELKNFQKALTAYQRALQFDEKSPDRLLDLARVYTRVDLDREAIELYKNVLSLDKNRHDVPLVLAQLYLKTGRYDDARREAGRYVAWEPRDPAGQRLLAEIDEASGDLASAARRREVLIVKDPSPQAYFDLGRLWVRAGQWDMAEGAFSKAEDLGLRTGALSLNRGVIRWLQGDGAGAEALWKKALERQPGLAPAHFFLGMLEKERGRPVQAAERVRQAQPGAQGDLLKALLKDFSMETGVKK